MNCPNCNIIINLINELREHDNLKPVHKIWYYLGEEEPLSCPICNTEVQIYILKEFEMKLFIVMLICFLMLLPVLYYSEAAFMVIVLSFLISVTSIKNLINIKYCGLAIKTHNNNINQINNSSLEQLCLKCNTDQHIKN